MEPEPLKEVPIVPIPEIFHDYLTGKPIERCIVCDVYLLDIKQQYLIEKAVKKMDVIFEFAICMHCAEKKRNQLSKESMARIESYFQEKVDLGKRREAVVDEKGYDADGWMEDCLLGGAKRSELEEYHVYGHFVGPYMMFSYMPYIISTAAMAPIAALLSPQTKDEMDRFIDDNFGLPPELKEILKDRDRVLF